MRLVNIHNLRPGLLLGRPLMDEKGQVLLHEGVALSEKYIAAIREKGFDRIYVKEPDALIDIPPDDDLNPATRARAISTMYKVCTAIEHVVPQLRQKTFADVQEICKSDAIKDLLSPDGPFGEIPDLADEIMSEVLTQRVLSGLTSIKTKDSLLYNHSIDVCVVAVMIGRSVGLDSRRMQQLATGCLLHDIGKVFLRKPKDEVTEIREHTLLGYELLRNSDTTDVMAPHVAYEHHEHQDGSGEPRGLTGVNTVKRDRGLSEPIITLIAEIAGIANVYDNLLSGDADQPPMTPDNALRVIQGAAGTRFNREVVQRFMRVVPVYPKGTQVLIRSGYFRNHTAIVSGIHRENLDRPIIKIVSDTRGNAMSVVEIDLLEKPDVEIRAKQIQEEDLNGKYS